MKKFESNEDIRNNIEQMELELEGIEELIHNLEETNDVQEYLKLLNTSKTVYNYIVYLNKERNIKSRLKYEKEKEKELIKKNCNHQTLLITTENSDNIINGGRESHFCTCLDCGEKKLANLSKGVIYLTSNFTYDDTSNIKRRYLELVKNKQVEDERLVIINNVSRKVKSKKKKI